MALEFLQPLADFSQALTLQEALATLQPMVMFVIGMVVYSLFVFKLYKFMASKDVFRVSRGGSHSAHKRVAYFLEYIFLFPIIAIFWVFVLSILLALLSDVIEITNIFTAAVATVATIRVAAYYNEELSREIAKLVPLALLALFLLDIANFSFAAALQVVYLVPLALDTLFYYFIAIVVLEFVLRAATYRRPKEEKRLPIFSGGEVRS